MFGGTAYNKACGCPRGMCDCGESEKQILPSERFKNETSLALLYLQGVEIENAKLKKENERMNKIAREKYIKIESMADKLAKDLISHAKEEAERIRREALETAETLKTLREGTIKFKVKADFYRWLIKILQEIDTTEIYDVVKDELEQTYNLKI